MKVKRFYLRSVFAFVLGFCVISLSTLSVNAAGLTRTITRTFNVTLYPNSSTVSVQTGNLVVPNNSYTISITEPQHTESGSGRSTTTSGGSISTYSTIVPAYVCSGSISPSASNTGVAIRLDEAEGAVYYSCPLSWDINGFDFPLSSYDSNYKYVGFSAWGFSATPSLGSFNDANLTYHNESVTNTHYATKESIYNFSSNTAYLSPTFHCSGVFNYAVLTANSRLDLSTPITFTVTVTYSMNIVDVSNDTVSSNSPVVNDVKGNELQQQANNLQTTGNTLQRQNNTTATNNYNTNKDTNNKITSFFGSFFDNLIGVFVPESGFFSQWFNDLNTFMSQKLGFLWSPFDFIITFLNGVYNGSGSPGITFPQLSWIDGTVIIPQTTINLSNIGGNDFNQVRDMIYFATDVILLGAVVHQFYQKIKLVFEGGSD